MSKMNPEIKAKWVEALRSGKYQQTQGRLKNTNGHFCCLGVLCDVQGVRWDGLSAGYGEDLSAFLTPYPLGKEAGLLPDTENYLARMNDDEKKSFVEIADWIEENL